MVTLTGLYLRLRLFYTMTNTPRTWKGDFEKRQSVREKDSFLDYGDDDCPPEINWDRLKAFISTIEDEAVRRERERMGLGGFSMVATYRGVPLMLMTTDGEVSQQCIKDISRISLLNDN